MSLILEFVLNKPQTSTQASFGFISVREIENVGHCGGLLIVSQIGRPIEFHCSSPVVMNRAQRILYGQTHDEYLYCEQIGLSLVDKAKKKPTIFIADCGQLLGLNSLIDGSIVVLDGTEATRYFDSRKSDMDSIESFEVGGEKVWFENQSSEESMRIRSVVGSFTKSLQLDEPFERIQKAIDEAQAVAR